LAGDHVGRVEQSQLPAGQIERCHRRLALQQILDHLLQHGDAGLAFELQGQPGEWIEEAACQPGDAVVVLDTLHEACSVGGAVEAEIGGIDAPTGHRGDDGDVLEARARFAARV
jgi:hypothetical protein